MKEEETDLRACLIKNAVTDEFGTFRQVRSTEKNSTIRKKEILPFATTWMNLEIIRLSKISLMKKKSRAI